MKKKHSLIVLIVLVCNISLFAQNRQNAVRKIKALKVNFITTELNLSSAEAEKFWPIYNEFEKMRREIRITETKKVRAKIKGYNSLKSIPETEAIKLQKEYFEIEKKLNKNKEKYFEQLVKAIGVHKILKLHLTEQGFNSTLLKQLGKERKQRKKQQ
jgi:hypothetical protein